MSLKSRCGEEVSYLGRRAIPSDFSPPVARIPSPPLWAGTLLCTAAIAAGLVAAMLLWVALAQKDKVRNRECGRE